MMGFDLMGGILFIAVMIIILAALFERVFPKLNSNAAKENARTAKQILDERYASGEITQEQYQSMLTDIS